MEKQIDQHMADYQSTFRTLPTLCMLLSADAPVFTIIDASDAYLAATMCRREDVVGKGIFVVFPDNPDDPSADGVLKLQTSLLSVINEKKKHVMLRQKYDIRTPEGTQFEERYWDPSNHPVFDKNGNVGCILHVAQDVTHMVQLEKRREEVVRIAREKSEIFREQGIRITDILSALMRYTSMDFSERLALSGRGDELDAISMGLNSLIDELERHIGKLSKANKDLEYANKELDSFSYSVSHDLRAPLRAISGYSQMLVEDSLDKLDDEGRQVVDIIVRNTKRMSALIDDLLAFSRLGKQSLSKSRLDMNVIVRNVMQDLLDERTAARTTIKLSDLDPVEGDSSMIRQVITNLLSNAIKYSAKKDNPVIELGGFLKGDEQVYFVKDNGAGFDMKYYDKLFGVFQRLHNGSEFEGTGVGLALVQRIVRKHRGDVWAESKPNEGATFYFSLPRAAN